MRLCSGSPLPNYNAQTGYPPPGQFSAGRQTMPAARPALGGGRAGSGLTWRGCRTLEA
jgi:hypothetical protein